VATAYKKCLRDGADAGLTKQQLREELGDVLWCTSTLAHPLDLEDKVRRLYAGKIQGSGRPRAATVGRHELASR